MKKRKKIIAKTMTKKKFVKLCVRLKKRRTQRRKCVAVTPTPPNPPPPMPSLSQLVRARQECKAAKALEQKLRDDEVDKKRDSLRGMILSTLEELQTSNQMLEDLKYEVGYDCTCFPMNRQWVDPNWIVKVRYAPDCSARIGVRAAPDKVTILVVDLKSGSEWAPSDERAFKHVMANLLVPIELERRKSEAEKTS